MWKSEKVKSYLERFNFQNFFYFLKNFENFLKISRIDFTFRGLCQETLEVFQLSEITSHVFKYIENWNCIFKIAFIALSEIVRFYFYYMNKEGSYLQDVYFTTGYI